MWESVTDFKHGFIQSRSAEKDKPELQESCAALHKCLFNLGYLAMFNIKGDLRTCCFLITNTRDGMEGRTEQGGPISSSVTDCS